MMLGQREQDAVKAFKEATADFVTRYGGVPHCPQCGMEAIPNPLPWIVGSETWSCPGTHGDFRSWESRVPPHDWRPAKNLPTYIHEAFTQHAAVKNSALAVVAFVGAENLPRNANLEKMEIPGELLRGLWQALGRPPVSSPGA